MYSDKSVIAFAKWWYGTEADSVFKGQSNVSVEQGFEWWKNNRASDNAESAPSASSNTTQAEIAITLLKRVSAEFHKGEEFDQPSHYANIVTDIDNYISQLSAVR